MCFSMRFTAFLSSLLFPGQALQQSPDTVVREGDSVTLNCSQKKNPFSDMYWYKLPTGKDTTLQLVVYSVEGEDHVLLLPSSSVYLRKVVVSLCLLPSAWSLISSLFFPTSESPFDPHFFLYSLP
uniref:Ig-like domain-containing protein n=1 Tax=Calidris pygmaea TaxID=425635 RepID=A0A8C3J7I2_9CHAR